MIFGHFLTEANESNAFVAGCDVTKEAILVDVGAFDPAIDAFVQRHGLHVGLVFVTHGHWDHTGGLGEAVARYGAEVLAGSRHVGGCPARKMSHGEEVRVGQLKGKVLATPGHTSDGLSLVLPGMVFTGDTLFAGSIGGTSDSRLEVEVILRHIFTLPGNYEVHPGHGPSSTVAIERHYNPFFVEP